MKRLGMMLRALVRLMAIATLLFVVGCSVSTESPGEPAESIGAIASAASGVKSLPQSKQLMIEQYNWARANPPSHLTARDAGNHPLLYYGRVFVRTKIEHDVLDVFGFAHDYFPFFDEYDPTLTGRLDGDTFDQGVWEYAIATGAQWNLLVDHPGIVSAVQMNPRIAPGQPHPMLDATTRPDGSLDPQHLANMGFSMPLPSWMTAQPCAGALRTMSLWDDIGDVFGAVWDALKATAGEVANWAADQIKKAGRSLTSVLEELAKAGRDVVDWLRELGNALVCEIAGERSTTGRLFVNDPDPTEGMFKARFGPNLNQPEPLRSGTMRARGGPGGVLLSQAEVGGEGAFKLRHLCGDLTYYVTYEAAGPAAWITYNGLFPDTFDVGAVGPTNLDVTYQLADRSAKIMMAAQIGQQLAVELWQIRPRQAKVVAGWFSDTIVGGVNGGKWIAACRQGDIISGFLAITTAWLGGPLPAAYVGSLTDGDIYAMSGGTSDPLATMTHEYGHFAMCEAIAQNGGDLSRFMNNYLWTMVTSGSNDVFLPTPLRNTAEAVADYFAFHALGYTNYFANDGAKYFCGQKDSDHPTGDPTAMCLEEDATSQRPPDNKPDPHQMIKSRAAIMYDWTDNGRRDYGFARGSPNRPDIDDDTVGVSRDALARGLGATSPNVSTESLAVWLSSSARDGRPAEAVCRVFQNHRWNCTDVPAAQLDAPIGFSGRGVSSSKLVWSWIPTSALATTYGLMRITAQGDQQIAEVPRATTEYEQTIPWNYGNQRIVAYVESRRKGSDPGKTRRAQACTFADPITSPTATITGSTIAIAWSGTTASDYVVQRAYEGGNFVDLALVKGTSYIDDQVAPGLVYRYRVQSRNCNGQRTDGNEVSASIGAPNDADFLFVLAGGTGGDGTRAKPFGNVQDAVSVVTSARSRILVAEGTYAERVFVGVATTANLPTGVTVSIYGGYDATFDARDPAEHISVIAPGPTTTEYNLGGGEFADLTNATFIAKRPLYVDGLEVRPAVRTCGRACIPVTLARAEVLSLVRVRYTGAANNGLSYTVTVPAEVDAGDTHVIDSWIEAGDALNLVALKPGALRLIGSTVIAGRSGTGISTMGNVLLDHSVVRGSRLALSQPGSKGIVATHVELTSSFVAGDTSLSQGGRGPCSPGFCEPSISFATNSFFYGPANVSRMDLTNNIFLSEGRIENSQARHCLNFPNGVFGSGWKLLNNAFVGLATSQTARAGRGLTGTVVTDAAVNTAADWFGSATSSVSGNRIVHSKATWFGLDTSPSPQTHSYHPLPTTDLVGTGYPVANLGRTLTLDLDGTPWSEGSLNIGPYTTTQ